MRKDEQSPEKTQESVRLTQQPTNADIERLKNELVSLVSRELRTPLTAIKGSLGLILRGACGELRGDLRDLLAVAYANNDRLIKLVNELLDLYKIEAGQITMRPEPVNLAELVERSLTEVSRLANQREILIVSSLSQELPPVKADADQLQRVMTNLLRNALGCSPPNNRVVISAEHQDGWVTVSVKDHGVGLAAEDQARIFDKFQQLDTSPHCRGNKTNGTGLELSLCKAIIERHEGKIGVQSAPGQGRRFFFSLPVAEPPPIRPEPQPRQEMTARGPRALSCLPCASEPVPAPFILTVDDDPGLRKVVARIVQHSGHQVETAANGEEAIEKIHALGPDLVILDILMPVLSGFGVVQTLKRQPETQDIPLLILTTKDLSQAERDALKLGPTKFLTKSMVTVESLTLAINELLQHSRRDRGVLV